MVSQVTSFREPTELWTVVWPDISPEYCPASVGCDIRVLGQAAIWLGCLRTCKYMHACTSTVHSVTLHAKAQSNTWLCFEGLKRTFTLILTLHPEEGSCNRACAKSSGETGRLYLLSKQLTLVYVNPAEHSKEPKRRGLVFSMIFLQSWTAGLYSSPPCYIVSGTL